MIVVEKRGYHWAWIQNHEFLKINKDFAKQFSTQRRGIYFFIVKFFIVGGERGKMNNPLIWEPNKDESNFNFRGNLLANTWILWTRAYEYVLIQHNIIQAWKYNTMEIDNRNNIYKRKGNTDCNTTTQDSLLWKVIAWLCKFLLTWKFSVTKCFSLSWVPTPITLQNMILYIKNLLELIPNYLYSKNRLLVIALLHLSY